MNGWLKVLVAAACIAVIAFVGYYFFKEAGRSASERAAIAAAENYAREAERTAACKAVADRVRAWVKWAELGHPENAGTDEEQEQVRALSERFDCSF